MTHITILVTSDIVTDQRIQRTVFSLKNQGFRVLVVGRRLKSTPKRSYKKEGIRLLCIPFSKGPLFYACFNLQAFLFLLFKKQNLIQANDLDTLMAAKCIGWVRKIPILYDSHELFTEVPELVHRPRTRKIWQAIEKRFIKNIKHCSTVSYGIAQELENRYGIDCTIIRNLPFRKQLPQLKEGSDYNTIIYQGTLNQGRGLEKLVEAMQFMPNKKLIIAGFGPLEQVLKQRILELNLAERVTLLGRILPEQLPEITQTAHLGVSIEEDLGLNYRYALPNKIFDYMQAGIPVLASELPEMSNLVNTYEVGATIKPNYSAKQLAFSIEDMLARPEAMKAWSENALKAADELCWEREQETLIALVERALKKQ